MEENNIESAPIGKLENIPLGEIKDNPRNNRDIESGSAALAWNIKERGLISPLTVYKGNDGKYIILSGHRRHHALIENGNPDSYPVPCYVVACPKSEFEEESMLSSGNHHRYTPEQIQHEVLLAAQTWSGTIDEAHGKALTDEEKAELTKHYREQFIKDHENDDRYQVNPAKFIDGYFRAKLEYIRDVTGLTMSNTTVKDVLRKALSADEQIKEPDIKTSALLAADSDSVSEPAPKKMKTVNDKTIQKQAKKFLDMLEVATIEDPFRAGLCDELQQNLENLLATYAE